MGVEKHAKSTPQLAEIDEEEVMESLFSVLWATPENRGKAQADDNQGLFQALTEEATQEEAQQNRAERQRFLRYMEDLRVVLGLPDGCGVRVLRHWLDTACYFTRLHQPAPQIYAATALADYARDRMAEMALADPKAYLRIHLAGARQWADEQGITTNQEREKQ